MHLRLCLSSMKGQGPLRLWVFPAGWTQDIPQTPDVPQPLDVSQDFEVIIPCKTTAADPIDHSPPIVDLAAVTCTLPLHSTPMDEISGVRMDHLERSMYRHCLESYHIHIQRDKHISHHRPNARRTRKFTILWSTIGGILTFITWCSFVSWRALV